MKPKSILKFFILAIIMLISGMQTFALSKQAEKEIQDIIKRNKTVGLAIVAVKDGKIIYNNTFGFKDLEHKTPLNKDNIFRIASISKSFTASSIMQLVEAGKIDLDGDVSDYVGFKVRNPKYPDTKITIKMLLSHSSSLNDSEGYFTLNVINPDSTKTWAHAYNDYAPGSKYVYCNLGYNTLGTILEKVSGERFDKYIVDHILKPIGVYGGYEVNSLDSAKFVKIYQYQPKDSSYIWSEAAYAPRTQEIANYKFGYSTPVLSPTGGMKISAQDLAKVMMMHMNLGKSGHKQIISKSSAELMQSPIVKTDEGDDHYGFAIEISNNLIDGLTMIGHTGSAYGVFTSMFWDADRKFGFVVMTNGCNQRYDHGFMSIHRDVDQWLYKNFIKKH